MYSVQHLGIGYIAAVLKESGYAVDVIECPGQHIDSRNVLARVESQGYDVLGISTYYYNFIYVMKLIKMIKIRNPSIFIFLGGYLPTLCSEETLNKATEADCLVVGEGEYTCLELVRTIERRGDWKSVFGIAYRDEGRVVKTPQRPYNRNLDELPLPMRPVLKDMSVIPVISSRGCYGRCSFCGVKEFYDACGVNIKRYRSPENVAEEIEKVVQQFNPQYVMICDETFFEGSKKRKEWLDKFIELMEEKGLNIKFRAQARANDIVKNHEYIRKMQTIGLTHLFIGIESFVQRQLEYYNKMTTVEQNKIALQIAGEMGLNLGIGFMLLDPFITIEEVMQNIQSLYETKCHIYSTPEEQLPFSMSAFMAIEGTVAYQKLKDENRIVNNELNYTFMNRDVNLYYRYCKIWDEKIQGIYKYFCLIKKSTDYHENQIVSELIKEKRKLMEIDLGFMEELCRRIMNCECEDRYSALIEEKYKLIEPIQEVFSKAETYLQGKFHP